MRPLTTKEAKLVKYTAEGMDKRDAYLKAYNTKATKNTASTEAYRTLNKPPVRNALELALKRKGLDIDSVLQPIADGLVALKTDKEDHNIRIRSASVLADFMGLKGNNQQGSLHFHQHITDKSSTYNL